MPTYSPAQLHELVSNLLPDNNENLIEPAEARQALDAIIDSFYNLVSTPNPTAPSLDNVLLEGNESGPVDLILNTGRYLYFRDAAGNQLRIRPVQDAIHTLAVRDVVIPLRSGTLAMLDDIGSSTWLKPVSDEVAQPTGSEPSGTRYLVSTAATGLFAGHAGEVAEKEGTQWQFSTTEDGDMVRSLSDSNGVIKSKEGGVWITPVGLGDVLSLATVLGVGNNTGAEDIVIDAGQAVGFRDAGSEGTLRLLSQPGTVTDDMAIYLPSESGTLALLADLVNIRLQDVLVAGNETAGRSIQISEFDGVNFLQGTNQVRVKAPASVTANRTLLVPDKDGTLATVSDVDAVAALIDGTMRAPEPFTPSGSYPVTYNGNAIERGDSFRLGAGTMGGATVNSEDLAIALVDAPGQVDGNWQILESNRVVATQVEAEDSASTDLTKLMPPQRWWQAWAKGLTLASFASAVRGVVLTGYVVGSNLAVAATDSLLAAIQKLQGQVNARLAKASNLSDVASVSTARGNLGLKAYATEDYAEAVVRRVEITSPDPVNLGHVVFLNAVGQYGLATPEAAASQKIGIVSSINSEKVRVQIHGICSVFSDLNRGTAYYLSPTVPGAITSVRPAAHAIHIGVAMSATQLDLRPELPLPSGSVRLMSDVPGTASAGTDSGLLSKELEGGGIYEVKVYASVVAGTDAGRVNLWLVTEGAINGFSMISTSASDEVPLQWAQIDLHTAPASVDTVTENQELEYCMSGILVAGPKDTIGLRFGPMADGRDATLKQGTIITWNRIG